jgi:hypothetical protein
LHIVDAIEEFATLDNPHRFLGPILLSLAILPFVYGVTVLALYEASGVCETADISCRPLQIANRPAVL